MVLLYNNKPINFILIYMRYIIVFRRKIINIKGKTIKKVAARWKET